ncbi:unnamed protein product [Sphacelaria rigidula]
MREKTEGAGEMVSTFQDKHDFGPPLSKSELERVNAFREERGRAALKGTPGVRFFRPGKNKEGYWGYEKFEA